MIQTIFLNNPLSVSMMVRTFSNIIKESPAMMKKSNSSRQSIPASSAPMEGQQSGPPNGPWFPFDVIVTINFLPRVMNMPCSL
jgi:hypothetical protein